MLNANVKKEKTGKVKSRSCVKRSEKNFGYNFIYSNWIYLFVSEQSNLYCEYAAKLYIYHINEGSKGKKNIEKGKNIAIFLLFYKNIIPMFAKILCI